jgi:uncharacterized membrane protein HdeD (DUF308 family)
MGNILTYLKWRGDLSFKEQPFNEVDNLILAAVSYLDLEGIVPNLGQDKSVTIAEASDLYFNNPNEINIERSKRLSVIDSALLKEMAQSERFKNANLSNFIDIMDEVKYMQFSALLIELEDDTYYISYRGTDNSILGWREDFTLSFQIASAQLSALEYLEAVIAPNGKMYRVGGHSKGGNLAMYAAMMCDDELREQILQVYNNDGPGFCEEMPWAMNYLKIQEKTLRIIPEFSVIGMLFESQDTPVKIIGSSASGLMQHHPMTWDVEGSFFTPKLDLTRRCKIINEMINTWIENVDLEHRKSFTSDLFDALGAGGANLVVDLKNGGGVDGFESILMALGRSDVKTKKTITKFIRSAIIGCRKIDFMVLLKTKTMIKGSCIALLGLFFLQIPELTVSILGSMFYFSILTFSMIKFARHLKKKRNKEPVWKFTSTLYLLLLGLATVFLVRSNAVTVSTNLLLSIGFITNAYLNFKHYLKMMNIHRKHWLSLINAIISSLFGIVAWVSAYNFEAVFIFNMAIYLIISGIAEIIGSMYENAQKGILAENIRNSID